MSINLDITKEEVLNLAAERVVNEYCSDEHLGEWAKAIISKKIEAEFAQGIRKRIDDFLQEEMTKILGQEITPVNIWGDREGQPTTIRAILAKRAQDFWSVKVDKDGKENPYGGKPRHEHLMSQLLGDEFKKAIKENAEVLVSEFKKAIIGDSQRLVKEHIEKLIR